MELKLPIQRRKNANYFTTNVLYSQMYADTHSCPVSSSLSPCFSFVFLFYHYLPFSQSLFHWPSVVLIPNSMKYQNILLDTLFITNFQLIKIDDSCLLYDRNFLLSPSIHKGQNSSLTSLLEIICSGETKLLGKINTVFSEFNSINHDSSLKTQTSCSHPSSPKLRYCNQRSRSIVLGFFIYILI